MWFKTLDNLTNGYGSIPINTIFSGMNIHLPAILMFTRGTRVLTHPQILILRPPLPGLFRKTTVWLNPDRFFAMALVLPRLMILQSRHGKGLAFDELCVRLGDLQNKKYMGTLLGYGMNMDEHIYKNGIICDNDMGYSGIMIYSGNMRTLSWGLNDNWELGYI